MGRGNQTTAGTTSARGETYKQQISRKKELFLLFWIDESDSGRKMFKESAQTRLIILKTGPWYDSRFHKIHCPNIKSFSQIQSSIDYWIKYYGGQDNVIVKEVSFFSHSGFQGPIIYNAYKYDPVDILIQIPSGKHQQMKLEYWQKINYYWSTSANNKLNFFGCNSANGRSESFVSKISSANNCLNIAVFGQPKSSYPSFYPDCRYTSLDRNANINWDYGPTYMVASDRDQGLKALSHPPNEASAHKMICCRNGVIIQEIYQAIFNDHRRPRSTTDSSELRIIKDWQWSFNYSS